MFTPIEAAKYLKISRSSLYNLIHRGEIGTISIGRSRRITEGQLRTFIEAKESQP
jgi:excisionase family DNA binding protein